MTIPDSVTVIAERTFENCSRLTSVVLHDNIATIGTRAFSGSGLTSIAIPNSVTSIASYAFFSNNSLSSVTVEWETPLNTNLPDYFSPFSGLHSRTTLYVPYTSLSAYKAHVEWGMFRTIVGVCEHVWDGDEWGETTPPTCTDDGIETEKCSICGDFGTETRVGTSALGHDYAELAVVEASTCDEEGYKARTCTRCGDEIDIESIPVLECCELCGAEGCDGTACILGTWQIGTPTAANVIATFRRDGTFTISGIGNMRGWTLFDINPRPWTSVLADIKTVIVENGVTNVGSWAFRNSTNLTSVIIPGSVTSFEICPHNVGPFDNCRSLTSVTVKYVTPISVNWRTFQNASVGNATLFVPEGTIDAYRAADVWKDFGFICSGHVWDEWGVTTPTTCTVDGEETEKCSICGAFGTETRAGETAFGHDYETAASVTTPATCTTAGEQSRKCQRDGCDDETDVQPIPATGHNWGDWNVTTPAICEVAGVETRTCSVCSDTETRPIAALDHDYIWTETTAATCTTDGEETEICSLCEATRNTRPIAATGHTWGNWNVTTAATCDNDGVETRTCSVCSETETRAIPKLTGADCDGTNIRESADTQTALRAWMQNGVLHISGLTGGKLFSIYSLSGTLIHQGIANSDRMEIALSNRGAYIIRSENRSVKIVFN
jgi:hypothetical protein